MADLDRESRTEEPTPRREEKAREEGQVARSAEIGSCAVLLAGTLVAASSGPGAMSRLRDAMSGSLAAIASDDLTPASALSLLAGGGRTVAAVALPIVLAAAAAGAVAAVAQVGFGVYPKRIAPDPNRLSPAQGLQRIFSGRGVAELVKSLLKIGLVSWVAWRAFLALQGQLPTLGLVSPRDILEAGGADATSLLLWICGALGAVAAADMLWQRRMHRQSLRMTRHEVREEQRQAEGDPKIRQRLRRAYRDLTGNRMLSEVAKASVVVTNPVHVAVALRYDPAEMGAPRVVAKGTEARAERIKQIARQNGVPIVERRALARALFRSVKVGAEIPAALYRAVAEILAYIYSLQAQRGA
jgi:flagellar biosynthetic protein FlhB